MTSSTIIVVPALVSALFLGGCDVQTTNHSHRRPPARQKAAQTSYYTLYADRMDLSGMGVQIPLQLGTYRCTTKRDGTLNMNVRVTKRVEGGMHYYDFKTGTDGPGELTTATYLSLDSSRYLEVTTPKSGPLRITVVQITSAGLTYELWSHTDIQSAAVEHGLQTKLDHKHRRMLIQGDGVRTHNTMKQLATANKSTVVGRTCLERVGS